MVKENIAVAKTKLSYLVNSALAGQDVFICKNDIAVVKIVALRPLSGEDPCRSIPHLTVRGGQAALTPLDDEDWGSLT